MDFTIYELIFQLDVEDEEFTTKCQLVEMQSGKNVSVIYLNSDEINDRHISLNII